MGKDMNKQFIAGAITYERCSKSLVTEETQIKMLRGHFASTRLEKMYSWIKPHCWDVRDRSPPTFPAEEGVGPAVRRGMCHYLIKFIICKPISLLSIDAQLYK